MSLTHAVPGDAFVDFLDEQLQFANRHGVSFEQPGWFLEKRNDYKKRRQKHEPPPADTLHKWQDLDALLEDYFNSVTIRTDTTPAEISDAEPLKGADNLHTDDKRQTQKNRNCQKRKRQAARRLQANRQILSDTELYTQGDCEIGDGEMGDGDGRW
jgi:hypothetical protein